MNPYSDKNVPVKCGECDALCEGKTDLTFHLFHYHKEYSASEVYEYVNLWIEAARIEQEEQLANYYDERKLDKAIHADAFPEK